jgi:hypothetical protein
MAFETRRRGLDDSDGWGDHSPSAVLVWCRVFSLLAADRRGSSVVEPRDFLAGVFASSLEFGELRQYWTHWEGFEDLIVKEYGDIDPRIEFWLSLHDLMRAKRVRFPMLKRRGVIGKRYGPEMLRIQSAALELARSGQDEAQHGLTVLAPEHILLAMVKDSDLEIGRKLADSGLDAGRLEQVIGAARRGFY